MASDLTGATDTELLEAVGRLEVDALGELYRRHGAAVLVLAPQLLGGAGAEDVTQEIFLYVWDHPDELLGMDGGLRSALLDQLRLRHLALLDEAHSPDETSQLTDEERAVLELALEGLGYGEAASRLGLPSTVVDGLLRSALNKVYDARVAPIEDSPEPTV